MDIYTEKIQIKKAPYLFSIDSTEYVKRSKTFTSSSLSKIASEEHIVIIKNYNLKNITNKLSIIFKYLKQNKSLEVLEYNSFDLKCTLMGNFFYPNEIVENLIELIKSSDSLKELSLDNTKLSETQVLSIIDSIISTRNLKVLTLRNCSIFFNTLEHFVNLIKENTSLVKLQLYDVFSNNGIHSCCRSLDGIISCLKLNTNLKVLNISGHILNNCNLSKLLLGTNLETVCFTIKFWSTKPEIYNNFCKLILISNVKNINVQIHSDYTFNLKNLCEIISTSNNLVNLNFGLNSIHKLTEKYIYKSIIISKSVKKFITNKVLNAELVKSFLKLNVNVDFSFVKEIKYQDVFYQNLFQNFQKKYFIK